MALPDDASLIVRLDDTSNIWQDTAGTTAASANGDAVRRWDDASGNGNNATLISGATAGTLATSKYSKRSVTCATTGFTFGQPTALVNTLNNSTAWTILAFVRPNVMATGAFIVSKGAGGNMRVGISIGIGTPSPVATVGTSTVGYDSKTPHSYACTTYGSEQISNSRIFIGGAAVADITNAISAADTTNDLLLGGLSTTTSYRFTGDICAFYIYSRVLSSVEVLQVSDYFYSSWGVVNPRLTSPYQLVFSGNSLLTIAGSATTYGAMPEKVRQLLGLPIGSVHNLAIGGQTNTQMITDDPGRLDGLLPYLSNPLLVGWECSNESNTTTYASWASARASAGWPKRMIGTTLPRTNVGFNTARDTRNNTIRAYSPSVAQYIWDVAADPIIGIDAACSDTGLYGDGVHYTEWASRYVSSSLAKAIRSVMEPAFRRTSYGGGY